MRILGFAITTLITITLVVVLNMSLHIGGKPAPPFGKFLSPQHGFWQNAESTSEDFSAHLHFPGLKGKVSVYLDDRLVPHIFAENDHDAYFVQGFIHAKFRLWQMEFQTHAAAGRISEIVGPIAVNFDRDKRRLGMVYAAENSLKEGEKDSATKVSCDSYTSGVNAYIESLTESSLPVEYKLLGYYPEKWTNLKTVLFLKYMSLDLAGAEDDFEMTNSKSVFSRAEFDKIYPIIMDSLAPIVPKGTAFDTAAIKLKVPADADSLYYGKKDSVAIIERKPDKDNGSNNWAVSGKKTQSGSPILCNDPHLGLTLPSIWFEMQITTPSYNVYGASFPGALGVIIGYNDSCAWGFTNAMRDVRDYYEIRFKDDSRKEYWFNNEWKKTEFRIEKIAIKDQSTYLDTVAYTIFGPVMYDTSYSGKRSTNNKYYSVRWKAHDPSNELKTFIMLNRAKNYNDYYEAIQNFHTPGQNCLFASKTGDIAIWNQGEFPAKWYRQGDFVMPGTDSSYMWQGMIPSKENPHVINPDWGYVFSANQMPVDTSYHYYLGGSYPPYRAYYINRRLSEMNNITIDDMKSMQTDNYNVFGEMAKPVLVNHMDEASLNANEKKYFDLLKNWDLRNDSNSKGATVFVEIWDSLQSVIWKDEFDRTGLNLMVPTSSSLLDNLIKDSSFLFLDDVNTPQKETLNDDVTNAFKKACKVLQSADSSGKLEWAKFKGTYVHHLARLEPFGRYHLPIGGGVNVINAAKQDHGPSWRMIVSLTAQTEAYGVYPGGQSGNPGSKYYDDFVTSWADGKYYPLWMMKASEEGDKRVKGKMIFD
jgi:penicillin G amidase